MVDLRWPRRGRFTDADRDLDVTGPCVVDVPQDAVAQYVARGWEHVDGDDGDTADTQDTADEPQGSDGQDGSADAPDGSGDQPTAQMDYDAFADMGYERRVDAVERGSVDDHLDRILDDDGSQNVRDAVTARQDELAAAPAQEE